MNCIVFFWFRIHNGLASSSLLFLISRCHFSPVKLTRVHHSTLRAYQRRHELGDDARLGRDRWTSGRPRRGIPAPAVATFDSDSARRRGGHRRLSPSESPFRGQFTADSLVSAFCARHLAFPPFFSTRKFFVCSRNFFCLHFSRRVLFRRPRHRIVGVALRIARCPGSKPSSVSIRACCDTAVKCLVSSATAGHTM